MLLFIVFIFRFGNQFNFISIHLMLLFIISVPSLSCGNADFNTSHVTVYPTHISISCFMQDISIHLMLLFIVETSKIATPKANFNTSHVTVYHRHFPLVCLCVPFQYISCYCLSSLAKNVGFALLHFNTSHVTVYQSSIVKSAPPNFISIHLMLLFIRMYLEKMRTVRPISIHLMLLFIPVR